MGGGGWYLFRDCFFFFACIDRACVRACEKIKQSGSLGLLKHPSGGCGWGRELFFFLLREGEGVVNEKKKK